MRWPQVKLEEITLPEKGALVSGPFGSSISAKFFVKKGVPVIRGNNLTKGERKFIDSGFAYLTETKAREFDRCKAKADDIIFTAAGSIGQVGIIPAESSFEEYVISNKQLRARLDTTLVDPMFVYYWLSSPTMVRWLESMNNGGAVPLLNLGIIRKAPVPLPPLNSQKKIRRFVEKYDDLIENNRRRIELLEQSARELYKEWFVRFRFPDHEHVKIVDGVPEGWARATLGKIANTNERSYKKQNLPDNLDYIDISSVSEGTILSKTPYAAPDAPGRARRIAEHGDTIWSNVRPNLRAYSLVMNPGEADVFSTGFTVLSAKSVPYTFLYEFVTTDNFVAHLVGHTTGASYPAVRPADFERAELVVPPEAMLEQFHSICDPVLQQINVLKNQARAASQARDLLLPKLMSGELAA